jgi:hypothetical protein
MTAIKEDRLNIAAIFKAIKIKYLYVINLKLQPKELFCCLL